jgi:hypothetical protein
MEWTARDPRVAALPTAAMLPRMVGHFSVMRSPVFKLQMREPRSQRRI